MKDICFCGHSKKDHLAQIFPGTCGHGDCTCSEYKELGDITFYEKFPSLKNKNVDLIQLGNPADPYEEEVFTESTIENECVDKKVVKDILFNNLKCKEASIDICEKLGIDVK